MAKFAERRYASRRENDGQGDIIQEVWKAIGETV